jgi:hypothetical protein
MRLVKQFFKSLTVILVAAWVVFADEGMWTFDNVPLTALKERYDFAPSQAWLDRLQLSTVKFNGGTGSFVSPNGLILTNHHVARGWLEELQKPGKNYVRDGFYARDLTEELKCLGMELRVLVSTENVTDRVRAAAKTAANDKDGIAAQNAERAKIEKESRDKIGLDSSVVALYQGGEYWLYRYKKYADVRLAFAPEERIGFFGGDADNFVYPRYALDFAFFRVYENGQPAKTENFLKWNAAGAAENELVFAAGHPGRTDRMQTLAQLEYQRDFYLPATVQSLNRQLAVLEKYAARGEREKRETSADVFGTQTGIKLLSGWLNGLRDKNVFAKKQREETEFRRQVESNSEWKREFGGAWDEISAAKKRQAEQFKLSQYRQLNAARLSGVAVNLALYALETAKPDAERINGFRDAQLDSMKRRILTSAAMPSALQEALLAENLRESLEELGADDPFVKAVLQNRAPEQAAKHLIENTKLADLSFRKSLVEGGAAAINASDDALLVVARRIAPLVRENREFSEQSVEAAEAVNGEKIGQGKFAVYGKSLYPDASQTLRLTFGAIKSYPLNGSIAPTKTFFYGLFDRSLGFGGKPPFDLPVRITERKNSLNLSKPMNFVASLDIVGGSSGSPVVNRAGEIVGVIFDTNIEAMVGRFVYDETNNRAVAVHTGGMTEALRKIYDAGRLADEIEGTGK